MTRLIAPLSAGERTGFITAARAFLDTPFRHRGRSLRGIDCLGLVACSLQAVGVTPQDERLYGREPEPDGEKLRAALMAHFGEPVSKLTPGCVVLMQWHKRPNHVAIVGDYPGGLSLIHALAEQQRVVEHRLAAPWDRRIVQGWQP